MNRFVLDKVSISHKRAGFILENISFSIPKEGIFSILGETGSGKTLLVKAMAGLCPYEMKTEGEIFYYEDREYSILRLNKKELNSLRGSSLLWVPQNSGGALNPLLRLDEQILLPLEKRLKLSKKDAESRIKYLLDYLDLSPKILSMYPHELSGGMKVRFMIAIGIAVEARVLILDEPTKGLDDKHSFQLMELLHKIYEEKKINLIIITHHLLLARDYTDNCAILHKGKLIDFGSTESVLNEDRHPYIKALWRALPINGMEASEYEC